jgi:PKHD-type hydroxylase
MTAKREIQNPAWAFDIHKASPWAYWDKAFTADECEYIKQHCYKYKMIAGKTGVDSTNSKVRKSKITWVYPHADIKWVYRRVTDIVLALNNDYFKYDLFGLVEGMQFTEYKAPSGRYGKHVDTMYEGAIRKLSFVIQLTDPSKYEGGELNLYLSDQPDTMKKEQGTLVAFPSTMLHEACPVTKGLRNSLVGWVTGRPFR